MRISILTPVYNGVEFLGECVESIRSQTVTDWELWIGINGHGDDGGEAAMIAAQLATDPRIHVIIQGPPLKGKVESLHNLMTHVTGEWIAILDCDDKWEPTKLERQVQAIQGDAANAAVVGTFCRYFGDRHLDLYLPCGVIDPSILETQNPVVNSSALIRKEYCTWEDTDMNDGVEDFHLWMKICLSGGTLYNLPEFLTWHRIHTTSAFNSRGCTDQHICAWYKNQRAI